MYINRIVLRDVRNFDNLDIPLRNNWTDQPLRSILLTGPNGSGKTTLLRVMAALWDNLGIWIRLGRALNAEQQSQGVLLIDAGLAAIEIRELLDAPLWLFMASNQDNWKELQELAGKGQSHFIGEIRGTRGRPQFIPAQGKSPWIDNLKHEKERLELGAAGATQLPNVLFLEAETRTIITPQKRINRDVINESLYRWYVTYEARERWDGHIETMLRNLKIRDARQFSAVIRQINFLIAAGNDKKIADFDDNLRLRVQMSDPRRGTHYHYIDDLSAGERQCLILVFMVSRWLMQGGIVLVDEPDLHLHVSLQRQLIHEMERIVDEQQGQIIVTSHSPTMWEEYSERQRIQLGSLEHA